MAKSPGQSYPFPVFLVILVLCLISYTFLHEAGHAILAYLAGADVRDIVIFSFRPHVSYADQVGGFFAPYMGLGGPLFPVIVTIVFLFFFPRTENMVLETSKTIFSCLIIFSLVGIIIALLLFSLGKNNSGDIVVFVSQNPGINPVLAMLTCLFLIIVLLVLIGKKTNYRLVPGLYFLLENDGTTITERKKKVILSLLVLLSLGLAGAYLFTPRSHELLCTEISSFPAGEVELYRFDVKEDYLTFAYTIQGLTAKELILFIRTDTSKTILFFGKEITSDIPSRTFVLHKGLHFLSARNVNGKGILTLNQVKD